jgi:hypothetical protein
VSTRSRIQAWEAVQVSMTLGATEANTLQLNNVVLAKWGMLWRVLWGIPQLVQVSAQGVVEAT